jgi:hypothetical protein
MTLNLVNPVNPVEKIFVHFLQLFRTFPLFFTTFRQNHPKTTPLFNTISHFLTTFCRFFSLFSALLHANSAHLRKIPPLHPTSNIQHLPQASLLQKTAFKGNISA